MKRGLCETCYGFFSTLANPTRLAILETLMKGPLNVTNIATNLNQEQSMISHNLKLLERCHFVVSDKRGKEKYFQNNSDTVEALFDLVTIHASNHCEIDGDCLYLK
jgi:DNA-binding transcriptional ArsR family regulator